MKDVAGKLVGAFSKGAESWDRSIGRPQQSEDLNTYNSLKPEDFPKLVERYGSVPVINYIHEMEHKRLTGG